MAEYTFWYRIWMLLSFTLIVVTTLIGGCVLSQQSIYASAKDPVALACANADTRMVSPQCLAIMNRLDK